MPIPEVKDNLIVCGHRCVSQLLIEKPIAAFVSSDGVEESFDQAGLYNFFYSIAYWLKEEGFDTAKAKVEGLLPQISEGGSGDDPPTEPKEKPAKHFWPFSKQHRQ